MEQDLTIKDVIIKLLNTSRYLFTKWKIILIVGIMGGILGLVKSINTHPTYTSSLKLIVDEEKGEGGFSSIVGGLGLAGFSSGSSLFNSSNIIEFLTTRPIIQEALLSPVSEKEYEKMTYLELYAQDLGIRSDWDNDPTLRKIKFKIGDNSESFTRVKDSLFGDVYTQLLKNEFKVYQPNDKNSIIQIDISSQSEVFAKNFASEVVKIAEIYYAKSKTKKAQQAVDALQHQVDSVQSVLFSSMAGVASSNDRIFGLNQAMNVQRVSSATKQVEVQMNTVILQELVKNLEISKMTLLKETPIINVIEKPVYPLKKERFGKFKGIVLGGIIAGFFIVLILLIQRYFKTLNTTKNS
jgi:uncharacterized protein involved in exopolysaccharide biosynthesis